MSSETKVYFGKQTQHHVGTAPTTDIFITGVDLPVGEITTHKWYKHGYAGTGVVVDSYTVTIWDIKEDKCFEAADYASARSALYAARRYAKEALAALHAPKVEETPAPAPKVEETPAPAPAPKVEETPAPAPAPHEERVKALEAAVLDRVCTEERVLELLDDMIWNKLGLEAIEQYCKPEYAGITYAAILVTTPPRVVWETTQIGSRDFKAIGSVEGEARAEITYTCEDCGYKVKKATLKDLKTGNLSVYSWTLRVDNAEDIAQRALQKRVAEEFNASAPVDPDEILKRAEELLALYPPKVEETPAPAPTKHVCGLCGKTLTPCKDGKLRRHNSAPGVQCDGSFQVAGTEVAWGAEVARLKAAPDLQISLTSEELQICIDYGYEFYIPSLHCSLNPWEAYSVACCLRTATWSTLEEGSAHLASLLDKLTLPPAEPLVKGFTEAPAPAPAPAPQEEEEERALRVTPPQTSALRALGYEVRSYKLRYYPSQVEEIVQRLYAERENHTRGNRRIYTSLIERISTPKPKIKRAKGSPRARFLKGDLSIEYTSQEAFTQFVQLVDAAESTKLITRASAEALRSALRAPAPQEEEEERALAHFFKD